jgi:glycosyltransferase involved in cell wall biosynthesis
VVLRESIGAPPGRADGVATVGFVGRLDHGKGVEDLLAAAARVDARFLIAGTRLVSPPEYEEGLRALAAGLPEGRVEFLGRTSGPEPLLARSDMLVVPSHREPWGRVAAEGMIAGLPVIATDAGGLPEVVTDGADGLLYDPGDVDQLVERIQRLVADPALRARLGANGRRNADRFSPSTHADAVASILLESAR